MDVQALQVITDLNKPNLHQFSAPQFVLVQDDVLCVTEYLSDMPWHCLDEDRDWQLLMGIINEFGKPEIIGTVVEIYPAPNKPCWRISSPLDGKYRLVGATGTLVGLVIDRLRVMFRGGVYTGDLLNLPETIVVIGCNA